MAELRPSFYYRNIMNSVNQITDSAGNDDTIKRTLYDRNENTLWSSVGEISGTSSITWSAAGSQTLTAIIIQNCNWADFTIKYNGGSDFSTAIDISSSTDTNFYFEFDSVDVLSVEIEITAGQVTNEVRTCGQIIFTEKIFSMAETYGDNITNKPADKVIPITLSDATTFKYFIREIRNYDIKLTAVPDEEVVKYRSLYELNKKEPFIFIPCPITQSDMWDGEAGHYNWINGYGFYNNYLDLKYNGKEAVIKLAQASGAI